MIIKEITPSETWPLRQTVMWPEKPIEYVQLKEDPNGLHCPPLLVFFTNNFSSGIFSKLLFNT